MPRGLAWANEVGVSGGTPRTGRQAGHQAVSANAIEARTARWSSPHRDEHDARRRPLERGLSQSWDDIDFGIEVRDDATIEIVEAGTSRGTFGAYGAGDRFRVEIRDGVVGYYRNGSVFYTSTVTPAYPLRVDTALYSVSATLTDLSLTSLVWTSATGVTVAENSLTKTAADGWNSGGSSTRALASGDGFIEFTAIETNTRRSVGLKASGAASSYADIDYAIDLGATGQLEVFELGVSHEAGRVLRARGPAARGDSGRSLPTSRSRSSSVHEYGGAELSPARGGAALYEQGHGQPAGDGRCRLDQPSRRADRCQRIAKSATSASWDSGAVSTRAINSGYVEATVSETNTYRMIGLSHGDTNASYTDLDSRAFASADG